MVIGGCYYRITRYKFATGLHAGNGSLIHDDLVNRTVVRIVDAKGATDRLHATDYAAKAALRVPRSELQTRIIHQAIQGRDLIGWRAEEKEREFHPCDE